MPAIDAAFLCDNGALILQYGEIVAQLDDRDMAQVVGQLRLDGKAVSDEALLAWLDNGAGALTLQHGGQAIPVRPLAYAEVPQHFGFQRAPQPA